MNEAGVLDRGYTDSRGSRGGRREWLSPVQTCARANQYDRVAFEPEFEAEVALASEADPVLRKFVRLRDEWKANRGFHSDSARLVLHIAYQKIIGMGPAVVPLILRELEASPDRWYWALQAITEVNPVPDGSRGNSKEMTKAWLEWGKNQGLICSHE
jgi:hypothetical protein